MRDNIAQVVAEVGRVLLGKDTEVKLALTCLLSEGHLLIEDLPGMGKTTLAHALAKVAGLSYQRVQFTSDMLPADIVGVSIFDQTASKFVFHPGPVFAQVLLADEINRTTPKTQSALLEAMEEGQVTVDGTTRQLPDPFFVIATQNPQSQMGTFALPESQLDRFLMRISLGYPSPKFERILFKGEDPREYIRHLKCLLPAVELAASRQAVKAVKASESLLDYVQKIVALTRASPHFVHGLSPRGAMGLLRAAKAWAYMHNRDYVVPDDVQAVVPAVVTHRVLSNSNASATIHPHVLDLLESVDVLP